MASVIVLGARGRFGRAAVAAFDAAGWDVTAAARGAYERFGSERHVAVDVKDSEALGRACVGQDVIVNAVNPPYQDWARDVPIITGSVIAAARACGATVMIPGNVYNYGTQMPPVLHETTPWVANTRKGAIRIRMENAFRDSGVRTVVLRGGDFIEAEKTGNWFDSHIAVKAWAGKFSYPGPRDVPHSWAYLPDMARAMAALAEVGQGFDTYEEFGFEGFTLTGDELADLVAQVVGRTLRIAPFPWGLVRGMALFSPLMREVMEMRYLWTRAHGIDGARLRATLTDFAPTHPQAAVRAALSAHAPQGHAATA